MTRDAFAPARELWLSHHPDRRHCDDNRNELKEDRIRISFCDRLGLPPRIMLIRPMSNTAATAATAIGIKTLLSNRVMVVAISRPFNVSN